MANWANPTITTQYDVFVAEMKERDVDVAQMFINPAGFPNLPLNSVRFNRGSKIFEEWNGTLWAPLVIGITGGGTGASSTGGIAAALGLGTMSSQNSNLVNISGGSIAVTFLSSVLTVNPVADLQCNLGDLTHRYNRGYISGGLVIPVGTDKYVVG